MSAFALPQVARLNARDRAARRRLARKGLTMPEGLREQDRVGHGSNARYLRHLKEEGVACVLCQEAHARLTTPVQEAPADFGETQWGRL